jgi:hypothetical protein
MARSPSALVNRIAIRTDRVVIDVLQDLVRDTATLPDGLQPVIWWSMV